MVQKFARYWEYYYSLQQQPFLGRNLLVSSICPHLYGLYLVKLSLLLILIGGVSNGASEKNPVRGQSHLLIVGDSSTGKSQLLLFASKLAIRSVMTTGLGTTSAGLTCSAIKESGEWMLEGGALVLGDRGLCCIDDFNSIREHDRATIHEVSQSAPSDVGDGAAAALGGEGGDRHDAQHADRGDRHLQPARKVRRVAEPLREHLHRLPPAEPLRPDPPPPRQREQAGRGAGRAARSGTRRSRTTSSRRTSTAAAPPPRSPRATTVGARGGLDAAPLWSVEELKGYILYVQRTFRPRLSAAAQRILTRYYQFVRSHNTSGAQATIRLLESLVRLAQAHARLMMRNRVLAMVGARRASSVGRGGGGAADGGLGAGHRAARCASARRSTLDINNLLYVDFPRDCEVEYRNLEGFVLSKLQLE